MKKICILVCYIGKLPNYFPYFTHSSLQNKTVDFLIFNDTVENSKTDNITYHRISLAEFNQLASSKLQLKINLKDSWKINELKPAFGIIFEDFLRYYDFWAWSDLDLIFGRITDFLTEPVLNNFDIISTKEHWVAGHFCAIRNTKKNNSIFKHSPNYVNIFISERYTAFEESCHRWDGEKFSIEYLINNNLLVSMFDIVNSLANTGELRLLLKDNIREYPQPINYLYERGKLFDKRDNQYFFYYHLHTVKKTWRFYIPNWKKIPDSFAITSTGIQAIDEDSGIAKIYWYIKRTRNILPKVYASIRKQGFAELINKIISRLVYSNKM